MYIRQVNEVDLTEARDRAERLMEQSKEVKKKGDEFGEIFRRAKEEVRQKEQEALKGNAIRTAIAVADLHQLSIALGVGSNDCLLND